MGGAEECQAPTERGPLHRLRQRDLVQGRRRHPRPGEPHRADIQGILGASIADKSGGSVTVADLDAALLHNTLGVQDEKITGAKAKEYTDIILREAQMYLSAANSPLMRR